MRRLKINTGKKGNSRIAMIVMAALLAVSLSACGSADNNNSGNDAPANADGTTETAAPASDNTEESSAEEVFSEPAEVVETAYFEENNIKFSDQNTFSVPFAVGTYDPDSLEAKDYKGITVEPQGDATITFGEIKSAKCDKEGYKAFTFDYTVDGVIRVTVDTFDYDENYSYEPQFPHVDMADYYTGSLLTYYPSLERKPDGKNKYDYIDNFSFNNKGYEIAYYNLESYGDSEEGDWKIDEASDDSQMQWYDVKVSEKHTIEVRIPEDYDGLVFAVNLNGVQEYDTSAYFEYMGTKDRLVFDEDPNGYTYKPNSAVFVRVADMNK